MPVNIPDGFVTRPKASKLFNRSQRQLERDLEEASRTGNHEVLENFLVVTKDGTRYSAQDITTDQIKELGKKGMVPTWYVDRSYLEREFGRKGSPKPSSQPQVGSHDFQAESVVEEGTDSRPSLPGDVEFLKQRIEVLERERREENERNEKREAKLFAQLEVKDKQISAWDELTQGLTKGLATGQLISAPPTRTSKLVQSEPSDVVDATIAVQSQSSINRPVKKATSKAKSNTKQKGNTKAKKPTRKKSEQPPKWNSFPTLKKLFSQ